MGRVVALAGSTKIFGAARAVDDLTCTVEPGVVAGFLGPNGLVSAVAVINRRDG